MTTGGVREGDATTDVGWGGEDTNTAIGCFAATIKVVASVIAVVNAW